MTSATRRPLVLTALAALAVGALASARQAPPDSRLLVKKRFADQQRMALSQPLVGVRGSAGVKPGLFPIRATGVSTEPVRAAAAAFLATLTPAQTLRTLFPVDDDEWRRWSNIDNGLYTRLGTSLREMTGPQQAAALALMRASFSAKGLALSQAIMKTDQTLAEINRDTLSYDERLYFFTVMGHPSATEPWGWQLDGHHLVTNYFVLGDQVVMTPVFMGGEPVVTTTGKHAGNTVMQDEQNRGLAFMRGLSAIHQSSATLAREKIGNDIKAQADADNLVLDPQGLRAADLPEARRAELLDLIRLYVSNLRDDQARVRMADVEAHLPETRFAWIGGLNDDSVFYYRIHSPVVLIEFDHQMPVGTTSLNTPGRPTRAHIHTVVRTPNGNDYGADLLRQHLATHRH
jgi:Protein of unknown function (DUF3500)